uniref:Ig-like domain-containing protein n=1 Tax=Astatotilapia calliptera TaxID=8154 RepID=A0A3P8QR32_ASTCA
KVRCGENVTLQCQVPRGLNITLLEWSKPEFNSESYVFFFRNQRPYENYQHEFFKGRVELRDPTMKDGDVSVILKNVNINDTGTYSCEITTRMKGKVVHEVVHSINLKVTDSGGFVEVRLTAFRAQLFVEGFHFSSFILKGVLLDTHAAVGKRIKENPHMNYTSVSSQMNFYQLMRKLCSVT